MLEKKVDRASFIFIFINMDKIRDLIRKIIKEAYIDSTGTLKDFEPTNLEIPQGWEELTLPPTVTNGMESLYNGKVLRYFQTEQNDCSVFIIEHSQSKIRVFGLHAQLGRTQQGPFSTLDEAEAAAQKMMVKLGFS